jgi:hypothetical protein
VEIIHKPIQPNLAITKILKKKNACIILATHLNHMRNLVFLKDFIFSYFGGVFQKIIEFVLPTTIKIPPRSTQSLV